ncbi:cyanoexosortase A system-associated protein [Myxosarcina sp. GI1]|uniref:cyanoexosortase A system-associated protein n=1 Tax=Myxosarcina sp. GI1 TaxID=1541065 RepID=UPI00068C3F83|nr:cyanoexosortase A system-associated protein [Myxosarcina sp. GI1]
MNNIVGKHQWRSLIHAATGISLGAIVLSSLFTPTVGNRQVKSMALPNRIALNSWQQTARQTLKVSSEPDNNNEEIAVAASYHYRRQASDTDDSEVRKYKNLVHLEAELRYIVGTRGDIKKYIASYTDTKSQDVDKGKLVRLEDIGYHYLFTSGDRAYLSSCISPRSQSNVTHQQFSLNRYRHDLKLQVWWNWLWGNASIRDRRCLWTHLSMSKDKTNLQTAYETLEAAWIEWYRWWQPRFPGL